MARFFSRIIKPDWEAFISCLLRNGTPNRIHFIELFLDEEQKIYICEKFFLDDGLKRDDPYYIEKREIILQRFLGYDYVTCTLEGLELPLNWDVTEDTASAKRIGGRKYVNQHRGPITTWEEFEAYPWPKPESLTSRSMEWYQVNLPEDMCLIGGLTGHFIENLSWLMGYETLCISLFEQRDLVEAIYERSLELYEHQVNRMLEFDKVKIIWGSDDMGFRSGPLINPRDMRTFVLPGHKQLAKISHLAGRPYLLHSCGNLDTIMDDLIDEVGINGKHSWEDAIIDPCQAKRRWGHRLAILGGIDMDFLCRASPEEIRRRVRQTLDCCQSGGGYLLGSGNTIANYVPIDNYLMMLDEGRIYS